MPVTKVGGLAISVAAAVAVAAAGIGATKAQTATQEPGIAAEATRTNWSERQLDAFAAAVVAVGETQAVWRMRIANADTTQQADDFRARMAADVEDEIAAQGLTVETYNRIFTAARADPRLNREIQSRIAEIDQ